MTGAKPCHPATEQSVEAMTVFCTKICAPIFIVNSELLMLGVLYVQLQNVSLAGFNFLFLVEFSEVYLPSSSFQPFLSHGTQALITKILWRSQKYIFCQSDPHPQMM